MDKIWKAKNSSNKDTGELMIFGDIDNMKWWDEDVTPQDILKDLEDLGDISELKVKINSNGGSVFAGVTISNVINQYAKDNNVELIGYVMGLAASIASVIACSLPNLIMYPSSMLMIHNPISGIYGNANDFRKMADDLDSIRESLIITYQNKTDLTREEIIDMLDNETWLTSEQCIDYGFADSLESNDIAASVSKNKLIMNGVSFDVSNYNNIPKHLIDNKVNTNKNKGVKTNMDFKIYKTEEDYNNDISNIKNAHKTELLENEEFVSDIRNGYVKVEDVIAKFEDLEVEDLDALANSVNDIKANLQKTQDEYESYKTDVENDKLFANRKETLENAGVEVKDEEKEDILALTDYALNKMVESAKKSKKQVDNKVDGDVPFDPNLIFDNLDNSKKIEDNDIANSLFA